LGRIFELDISIKGEELKCKDFPFIKDNLGCEMPLENNNS
jgi:hypothetical protein